MPPVSETWGMLFGGAGDSKGPLLLFVCSVLLWGYPMYMIRVSSNTIQAELEVDYTSIAPVGYSNNLERSAEISLLFHLLEYRHVGQLDHSESSRSRLYRNQLRTILQSRQTNSVLWEMEKTEFELDTIVSQLPLPATAPRQTLSHLQSMCFVLWSPLPVHLQLRGTQEPDVVLLVCLERRYQLHFHHLLCLVLRHDRRLYPALHAWTAGGHLILLSRLDPYLHLSEFLEPSSCIIIV